MRSSGRSELILGLFLMIPGIIAAVFADDLPVRALFDPRVVADSIVGTIVIGAMGLSLAGVEAIPVIMLYFGLALLTFLYYVGAVAVIISVVSIVRNRNRGGVQIRVER